MEEIKKTQDSQDKIEIKKLEEELYYLPTIDGNYFIFSSKTGSWIIASKLMSKSRVEKYLPNKISKNYKDVRDIVINTTNRCNLRCKYCYVRYHEEKNLTPETFKKIVDSLLSFYNDEVSHFRKPIEICFHGSEPLENWDNLKEMIKYVTDLNKKLGNMFKLSIQTNATLIDENKAKFLRKNDVGVGVSIDGYEEVHNRGRSYINNKGSFKDVMKGIKILFNYYGPLNALCVVSIFNVNELKKVYLWFKESGIFNQIRFLFVHPDKYGNGTEFLPEINDLLKNYIPIFSYELENISLGREPFVDNIETRIINFVLPKVYPICGKCANTFIQPCIFVDIDGSLKECDSILVSNLGGYKIWDFKKLEDLLNSQDNFRTNFSILPETCKNCIFLYICGGGCPSEVIDNRNYYCKVYREEYKIIMANITKLIEVVNKKS